MKSFRCFLCLLLISFCSNFAQDSHGIVKEGLTIKSEILQKDVRYTVYLPFDYETSSRYYAVVYLLHGYSDNDMGWIQFGEANLILDKAIANQELPPMILVMPDGGVTWYINNFDNSVRYEDFFVKEFMPAVEKQFRIRSEKRYRGISGLSMGGFGSLTLSMRHTDLFSACAAFSAAVYTKDEIMNFDKSRWNRVAAILYGPELVGEKRITDHLISYNPLFMLDNIDIDKLKSVRFYLDCGDDDHLTVGNSEFHIALRSLGINHEYRVRNGDHRWSYWRSGLLAGLQFIGESFHQQ
ncbi:MAG: alpha/beta hydrolase-fold protein [bacterium]